MCHGLCELHNYRLGDIFRGVFREGIRKQRNKNVTRKDIARWLHNCWPGSILDRYMSRTNNVNDYTVLNEIVSNDTGFPNISSNNIVVHIRAGDTIFNASKQFSRSVPFSKTNLRVYVFDRSYYKKVILMLSKYDITSVILVASFNQLARGKRHMRQNMKEEYTKQNLKYIHLVQKLFLDSKLNVSLRINQGTPDEDFLFMSDAKIFIAGGGGYSNLIARTVEYRGGIVIEIPN